MEPLNEIEAELSGISPVLGKSRTTVLPYTVPAGYFEHFAENLLQRIRMAEHEDPRTELNTLSPLLAGLDRKSPYQVPADYFNEFSSDTASFRHTEPKLIRMRSTRRVMKYAIAAMVTGLIATAAFFTFNHSGTDPLQELVNVSSQDMANYLDNHDVHWVPGTAVQDASAEFNDNDISDLLSNVSDSELEQYLPELPEQKQATN
jgi:hypothetical protein